MKAIKFVKFALTILLVTMFSTPSISMAGGVTYPVVSAGFRQQMVGLGENTFVGSENIWLYEGEFIAVTQPSHPDGAELFRVRFMPSAEVPGLMIPNLVRDFVSSVKPVEGFGYYHYPEGGYDVWGSAPYFGKTLHFIAWSDWDPVFQEEYWTLVMTWGEGSEISKPGDRIDRTQFGTIPGEPEELGFYILGMDLEGGDPSFLIFFDQDAEFTIDRSTDLSNWNGILTTIEEVPEAELYFSGVTFYTAILRPVEGGGRREFFKLRRL